MYAGYISKIDLNELLIHMDTVSVISSAGALFHRCMILLI